jgi:hypothetical protein
MFVNALEQFLLCDVGFFSCPAHGQAHHAQHFRLVARRTTETFQNNQYSGIESSNLDAANQPFPNWELGELKPWKRYVINGLVLRFIV